MQQEIKTHFKMYKAGKHWLTMGLGMTLLSASFITVTTQKAAAETTDTTAATTTTTTADSSGSYQLSTATTGAEVQSATATAGATSSSIQVAATSQSMTNTNSQTSTTSIITTDSAVSTAAASANQTSATATSSVAASASAAILSQVNSAAGVSTTDTQTSAATAITDNTTSAASTDVHNEVADQFIAGQRSDTNPAAQVPAVGTINSYINAVGQNQIDIPTGLAEDVQTQWLANAKAQATQDYQTTGRQQVITLNDATVDTWTIGDSSRPTVDAVDISSYQGGMTQANFNTLKQLGVKTVIVKLTENTNYTNPYASSQINMARAARLNVEVYHYAKFSTSSAAAAEANYLANVMSSLGLSGNTLVFADMEDTSTYAADVAGNLNQFWRTLSGRGYTNHGVYTYVSYAYRDAVVSTVGASRTWMAQYPYSPSAGNLWNTGYGAWQFSSTACLPGYSGYLDVSVDYSNLLTTETNENKGNFDHVSIHDNVLHIDGWQAADDAEGKNSSYLILFDKTTNSELGRYQIDRIARPDVAAAYPNIYNCGKSGFSIDIPITFTLAGHDIYVISRYSDDATHGEGNHVDLWSDAYHFNTNAGYYESVTIDEDTLHITGWHAADGSYGKDYSYIILYDKTSNQELGRYEISRANRADVGQVYLGTYHAVNSGFDINIPLTFSLAGREIYIISRYSDDATHGEGNHVDLWSDAYQFNQNVGFADHVNISADTIHIDGWSAADASYGKPYSFVFLMDASGHEITRHQIERTSRNDVAKVYRTLYGADQSGFSVDIPITAALRGQKFSIMVRYSADPAGNHNYVDTWLSGSHTVPDQNVATLDDLTVTKNAITVAGWHAADASVEEPYRYVFVMDNNTGLELARYQIADVPRPDVANAYPNITNATTSGFYISIPVITKFLDKDLRIMVRYSNDILGNGLTTDYWFTPIIKLPFQTI